MRNQSFMHTHRQYQEGTKTVTRRLGWKFARMGDVVRGCRKCRGLKKGEWIEVLGHHRFINLRWEPLCRMIDDPEYGAEEVIREGFPEMTPAEFVDFFCKTMKCKPSTIIHRMEYEHIDIFAPV